MCEKYMWGNLNFINTNIEIIARKYIHLYKIILGNYQISLATVLGEFTAYILTCIFTTIR